MVPHSTILMCYWFSCNLIPTYWCVIDSYDTAFQLTDVLTILVWPYSSILKYCWFSGDLKYCWFSGDLMLAYWCVIDSHLTSFQHTEVLLILMVPHSSIPTDVLLILMWPHSSILVCYWFSCDLIPAYWGIVDSQVISFWQTNVLLILMWPHSSILMCYWFSCTLFKHTDVLFFPM